MTRATCLPVHRKTQAQHNKPGVDIQHKGHSPPPVWEAHRHHRVEQRLGVSLVKYRPTLDCQALSIIALTSKFQRSSVTLLTWLTHEHQRQQDMCREIGCKVRYNFWTRQHISKTFYHFFDNIGFREHRHTLSCRRILRIKQIGWRTHRLEAAWKTGPCWHTGAKGCNLFMMTCLETPLVLTDHGVSQCGNHQKTLGRRVTSSSGTPSTSLFS